MGLTTIDWVIMAVYFAFVLGIGAALKRNENQRRFFLARSFDSRMGCRPGLYLANLGAQEVIGMGASERSMAFSQPLSIGLAPSRRWCSSASSLMPFYYGSRARSCRSIATAISTKKPAG